MNIKKIAAFITASLCIIGCISCGKTKEPDPLVIGENYIIGADGVGELIEPAEDSEEYSLGSYRLDANGIKLYYEEPISVGLVLAIEKYFTSYQNRDFELYKSCIAADYAERYDAYLKEKFDYDLQSSFELQCKNIRDTMKMQITGEYDADSVTDYTGDFTITRIRAEEPELHEGETQEDVVKNFFAYLDEAFDMDYYSYVAEQADSFEYATFFVIAEGEDDKEHRIVTEMNIVFAVKDGKYYTFG